MGKTKIEWADYTWNPITGCHNNCEYCYARRMSKRFSGNVGLNISDETQYKKEDGIYILEHPFTDKGRVLSFPFGFNPTFHKYRLKDPEKWKSGQNIFVGSMTDIFGEWVPDRVLKEIFSIAEANSKHNYLFLTKNPKRYINLAKDYLLPNRNNFWYGYSVTNARANYCDIPGCKTYISFEPILEDIDFFLEGRSKLCDWAIIGAETGNRTGKVTPKKEWIDKIVTYCDIFDIPVFMKDSLIDIVGEENMRRELPEGLKRHEMSEKNKKRFTTQCAECHNRYIKKYMFAILEREKRGQSAKALGYICNNCIDNFRKRFRNENTNDS